MVPVSRKQNMSKLIQALDSGNFVMVQFYFCAWYISHPCFFGQKVAFYACPVKFRMLKFFSLPRPACPKNRLFPKTVRFHGNPAHQGAFDGWPLFTDLFQYDFQGLCRCILRRANPFPIGVAFKVSRCNSFIDDKQRNYPFFGLFCCMDIQVF